MSPCRCYKYYEIKLIHSFHQNVEKTVVFLKYICNLVPSASFRYGRKMKKKTNFQNFSGDEAGMFGHFSTLCMNGLKRQTENEIPEIRKIALIRIDRENSFITLTDSTYSSSEEAFGEHKVIMLQ